MCIQYVSTYVAFQKYEIKVMIVKWPEYCIGIYWSKRVVLLLYLVMGIISVWQDISLFDPTPSKRLIFVIIAKHIFKGRCYDIKICYTKSWILVGHLFPVYRT